LFIIRELGNESEATRLEALRWISVLLERHRTEVNFLINTSHNVRINSPCRLLPW
jgi:hypothetical protein